MDTREVQGTFWDEGGWYLATSSSHQYCTILVAISSQTTQLATKRQDGCWQGDGMWSYCTHSYCHLLLTWLHQSRLPTFVAERVRGSGRGTWNYFRCSRAGAGPVWTGNFLKHLQFHPTNPLWDQAFGDARTSPYRLTCIMQIIQLRPLQKLSLRFCYPPPPLLVAAAPSGPWKGSKAPTDQGTVFCSWDVPMARVGTVSSSPES